MSFRYGKDIQIRKSTEIDVSRAYIRGKIDLGFPNQSLFGYGIPCKWKMRDDLMHFFFKVQSDIL